MNLLFYSKTTTSRLKYICHQVFKQWLGIEVHYTHNIEIYRRYEGVKINYSKQALCEQDFLIPDEGFLIETTIAARKFSPIFYDTLPVLFPSNVHKAAFSFDLFANIFFHLSRYEEYVPFKKDQHGRFTATKSWAYRHNCLQQPIVNLLIKKLKEKLQIQYPSITFKAKQFQFLATYDIDMAWAFRYKGWKRSIGAYANDLLAGQCFFFKNRIKTQLRLQKDPFQTFDLLAKWSNDFNIQPIYFFLLADHGEYDKNNLISARPFQQLIQKIAQANAIGIHPSYQSNTDFNILQKEKKRLETISQTNIHRSRQHFLKLHLPHTYQQLLKIGIQEDYSMGYAQEIGFRAGTALPFYWYDLEKEEQTTLLIYPFQVMDVTLKEYLKWSPEIAIKQIRQLIAQTKAVNGIFCTLWHNSSFSELEGWDKWKSTYLEILKTIQKG